MLAGLQSKLSEPSVLLILLQSSSTFLLSKKKSTKTKPHFTGFHGTVSVFDYTLVKIFAPSENVADYVNQEGDHTLSV